MSADALVAALRRRGWTVATAESLTAGLVSSSIAEVPGCSDVLVGGIVAYRARIKSALLRVPSLEPGLVSREVAEAMSAGVCREMGSDVGIATTGAAGPEPHDGAPVGSVWVSVCTPEGRWSEHLQVPGDRAQVRARASQAALALAARAVESATVPGS